MSRHGILTEGLWYCDVLRTAIICLPLLLIISLIIVKTNVQLFRKPVKISSFLLILSMNCYWYKVLRWSSFITKGQMNLSKPNGTFNNWKYCWGWSDRQIMWQFHVIQTYKWQINPSKINVYSCSSNSNLTLPKLVH